MNLVARISPYRLAFAAAVALVAAVALALAISMTSSAPSAVSLLGLANCDRGFMPG